MDTTTPMGVDTPQVTDTPTVNEPTPSAVPKFRKPNLWISHVKQFRLDHAERIKTDRLSCGQISKEARASYKPRAKCATCGK